MDKTDQDYIDKNVKPVPGWENYFVDRLGNVYSNLVNGSIHRRIGPLRKLHPRNTKVGYLVIVLKRPIIVPHTAYVHHLVLETFVGPRPEKHYACHKNDVKHDNRLGNLYWGSPLENSRDALLNNDFQIGKKRRETLDRIMEGGV